MKTNRKLRPLVICGGFPTEECPYTHIYVKKQIDNLSSEFNIILCILEPVFLFSKRGLTIRKKLKYLLDKSYRYKVAIIPYYYSTKIWGSFFKPYAELMAILKFIILNKVVFDIIHSHFIYSEGFVGILLGKILRKPVIVSSRIEMHLDIFQNKMLLYRHKLTASSADRIVAISNKIANDMIELGADYKKIEIIPNSVDASVFYTMNKNECRTLLGLPINTIIVGFIGMLERWKGISYLVEAIPDVLKIITHTNILFLFVGDGNLREWLKLRTAELGIRDKTLFIALRKHHEIPLMINAFDILCLPSIMEGLGMVVIEALACGIPVVVSKVGGLIDIVSDSKNGIFCEPENTKSIVSSLIRAINCQWDRDMLRKSVLDKFNRENEIYRMKQIYSQTLCKGRYTLNERLQAYNYI